MESLKPFIFEFNIENIFQVLSLITVF